MKKSAKTVLILFIFLIILACSKDTDSPLGPPIETDYPFYSDFEIGNEKWVTDFDGFQGIPSAGLDVDNALAIGIPIHCYVADGSSVPDIVKWTNETSKTNEKVTNHYMEYYYEQNPDPGGGWIWFGINIQFINGSLDVTKFGNAIKLKVRGTGRMHFKFSNDLSKLIPLTEEWQEHIIRFEELGDIKAHEDVLKNLESISIGPEENQPGTSGIVNIDDIRFVTYVIKR